MSGGRREIYRGLIDRVVADEGLEIVELLIPQDRRILLTVDADAEVASGVSIDALSHLHRQIVQALAHEGFAPELIHLEVQSPGLDRKLTRDKDFTRFAGREVKVVLKKKQDGRVRLKGALVGLEGDTLVVDDERDGRLRLERHNVKEVRLVPDI